MFELLTRKQKRVIEDPAIVKFLFTDARMSVLWLVVRVYVGWQWATAGLHKIFVEGSWAFNEGWVGTGASLQGFWERIVAIPESGRPAINYDWYRSFIQYLLDIQAYTWF